MKLTSAGLGGNADLRTRGTPVLGSVIGREDLDLLCGVHVSRPKAGTVGASARARGAIIGDQVFWVARSVEIRGSLIEIKVESCQSGGTSARHQR